MFKDPFGWFPTPFFSSALALLFLSAFALDWALPWLTARDRPSTPVARKDRWSYQAVQAAGLLSVVASVGLRNLRWGIAPVVVQYLGLALIPIGLALRLWAIARLGRFFSRVVEIETDHRLVTDGPYRRIRHPAYTGMLLIFLGVPLAIGTWLGTMATLVLVGAATLYRIHVEEQALLEAFGEEYRSYMGRTWRLFPGF